MAKRKNISKHNFSFLIPQIAVFFLLALVFRELNVPRYALLSLALYLLLSGYLKVVIPKWHRKGLYYIRKGELEGASFAFKKSYSFFSKHIWVDKYRAFTLLSISGYSYREMALMNMIFCYSQLGKTKDAKDIQKLLSKEFPENPYGSEK
jgi:hypothetical protein